MSEVEAASLLEALPSEIFNIILGYIFDPSKSVAPPTATTFGGYRFSTSILRVNKAIHRLAKSYLHSELSWIRLDINWHAFLINPLWLGVPYVTLDRANSPKIIPYSYVHGVKQRLVIQDAPVGRIAVSITYPPPITQGQVEIRTLCFPSPSCSSLSVLVLEADFYKFVRVLRMNDLAYIKRSKTGDTIQQERSLVKVHIPQGQEDVKHRDLFHHLKTYIGPYCTLQTIIVPTGHSPHQTLPSNATTPHRLDGTLLEQIAISKPRSQVEGVNLVMYLKSKGDSYLRHQQRDHAFMCYNYAVAFEAYWQHHDAPLPSPNPFWAPGNNVYKAFGAALSINMSIACVTSDFNPPLLQVRHVPGLHYNADLLRIGGGPHRMGHNRYIELCFASTVCHLHTLDRFDTAPGISRLVTILRLMTADWEMLHHTACAHESSSVMGKVYTVARDLLPTLQVPNVRVFHPMQISAQARLVSARIDEMRGYFRGANIAPLRWAVKEERFPRQLLQSQGSRLSSVVLHKVESILAQRDGVEALRRARARASGINYPVFDGWSGVDGEKRILV